MSPFITRSLILISPSFMPLAITLFASATRFNSPFLPSFSLGFFLPSAFFRFRRFTLSAMVLPVSSRSSSKRSSASISSSASMASLFFAALFFALSMTFCCFPVADAGSSTDSPLIKSDTIFSMEAFTSLSTRLLISTPSKPVALFASRIIIALA